MLKNYYPIQITASFSSTVILFNHKKICWFGKNGTINCMTPQIFELRTKVNKVLFSRNIYPIAKLSQYEFIQAGPEPCQL